MPTTAFGDPEVLDCLYGRSLLLTDDYTVEELNLRELTGSVFACGIKPVGFLAGS